MGAFRSSATGVENGLHHTVTEQSPKRQDEVWAMATTLTTPACPPDVYETAAGSASLPLEKASAALRASSRSACWAK
jgi:hypothetical protein